MMFRPPKPTAVTLNLAPMVDVMMCLIIFFLLASKLVSSQNRPLNLPFARAAEETESREPGTRIVVNVRPSPARAGDAEFVLQRWDGKNISEKIVTADELPTLLLTRAEQARTRGEEVRCVIRADRTIAAGHVESVLRAAGLAKIAKIVFAANAGDDPGAAR
ncbi:MAG: ExbD/TolR family protein [Phycisphaerae bacterium]